MTTAHQQMATYVQALRDLAFSMAEYPAEWPDDLLAEVDNLAAAIKGSAQSERLFRAVGVDRGTACPVETLPTI